MAVGRWLTLLSLAVAEECNVEFLQPLRSPFSGPSDRSHRLLFRGRLVVCFAFIGDFVMGLFSGVHSRLY